MATDKSYGKIPRKKKKKIKKVTGHADWASKPGDGTWHVSEHDPDAARRNKHG